MIATNISEQEKLEVMNFLPSKDGCLGVMNCFRSEDGCTSKEKLELYDFLDRCNYRKYFCDPLAEKKINHTALRELLIFVNNKKNKFVNNNKNKKPADADTLEHMKRLMDNFLTIAYRGEDALNRAIKVYEERVDVIKDYVLKNKTIENFYYLFNVYEKLDNKELTLDTEQIEKLRYINEYIIRIQPTTEYKAFTEKLKYIKKYTWTEPTTESKAFRLSHLGYADENFINDLLTDGNLNEIYKGFKAFPYINPEILRNNTDVSGLLDMINTLLRNLISSYPFSSNSDINLLNRLIVYEKLEEIERMVRSDDELSNTIKKKNNLFENYFKEIESMYRFNNDESSIIEKYFEDNIDPVDLGKLLRFANNIKADDLDSLEQHVENLMNNFYLIHSVYGEDALKRAIKVYEERVDVIENNVLKNETIANFEYLFNVYKKCDEELTLDKDQIEKLTYINERMKSEHRQSSGVSEGWDLGNDEHFINDLLKDVNLKDGNLDKIYKGLNEFYFIPIAHYNDDKGVPDLLNKIAALRLEKLTQKDVAGHDDSGSGSENDQKERLKLYKALEDIKDMSSDTELINGIKIIQYGLIHKIIIEGDRSKIIINETCEKELTWEKYFEYWMGYWRAYFQSCRDSSNEHENYCYTEEDLNNGKEVNQTNLYAALTLYTNLNKTLNKHDILKNRFREDSSKIHPQEYQEVTQTNIYLLHSLCDKIDACLKPIEETEQNLTNRI